MNLLKIFSLIALTFTLTSCGKGSEYVNVKIITPIGMNKNFQELKNQLFNYNQNNPNLLALPCLQSEVYIGTNEFLDSTQIATKRINIYSNFDDPTCFDFSNDPSNCLRTSTTISNADILVKRGADVDIAIMGAYFKPVDTLPDDGLCDRMAGSIAARSISLRGRERINVNAATTVSLDVWSTQAYPASTPAPGLFTCTSETCLGKRFTRISPSTLCKVIAVEYFPDKNSNVGVKHALYSSATANSGGSFYYYVPAFFPMRIIHSFNASAEQMDVVNNTGSITFSDGCVIGIDNAL